jgi:hypothetical protein
MSARLERPCGVALVDRRFMDLVAHAREFRDADRHE